MTINQMMHALARQDIVVDLVSGIPRTIIVMRQAVMIMETNLIARKTTVLGLTVTVLSRGAEVMIIQTLQAVKIIHLT